MRRDREEMNDDDDGNQAQQKQQPQQQQQQQQAPASTSSSRALTYFFFSKDDLVWIHPKRGYPLWPAEVQEMDPKSHICKCRLIAPPEEALAEISAHASKLIYFDKFASEQAMNAEIERKLQRDRFDVSNFEQTFRTAVRLATRLASCPMTPTAVREDMQFCVAPIGVVHSPFRSHCDAPRQPSTGATLLEGQGGVIRVTPELAQGLQDLKGFERIWVLFHFSFSEVAKDDDDEEKKEQSAASEAAAAAAIAADKSSSNNSSIFLARPDRHSPSTAFSTLIVPPRDSKKRGVFATRTPHRPNMIGLSCVRVLDVRGCEVHITDHDLLHGTPVLDIKPYLPFCDAHPNAKAGWVDVLNRSGESKGDHRPAGTTDYSCVRTRDLTLERAMALEGGAK